MKNSSTEQSTSVFPEPREAPLQKRLIRFFIALLALWAVVYVLAPLPVEYFGPLHTLATVAEENNIHPGALFYTDVPVARDAEIHNRASVLFSQQHPPPQ